MAPRSLLDILNDPIAVEGMLANRWGQRFGDMRSHELSPSEQIKYNVGQLQDPGTPGDKRDIYERAGKQVDVAQTLVPPLGAGMGLLDLGYANRQMREGTGSAADVAMAIPGALGVGGLGGLGGITRGLKLPRLTGVLHGTGVPTEFSIPKLPPPTHDLGTHVTIDPHVTEQYHYAGSNKQKWIENPPPGEEAGERTKPFLGDFRSAMRFPYDAGKWNIPENVISNLTNAMRHGFKAPRGLLEDLYNIGGSDKTWQRDFIPMMQKRGVDSLYYPHATDFDQGPILKYNTFMSFDPANQLIPRYSSEGQKLIKERGVRNPMEFGFNDTSSFDESRRWSIPRGVLYKPTETETLKGQPDLSTSIGKIHKGILDKEWADSQRLKVNMEQHAKNQAEKLAQKMTKLEAGEEIIEAISPDKSMKLIATGPYTSKWVTMEGKPLTTAEVLEKNKNYYHSKK